ncbi:hypothetical protein [Tropicibacter oceani]|uniref:Bile acid:sodium symporter n=1 Tax=Tropicibacter oceani TaxID=3058420 RepID=A0ABY8QMP5_9RHOB|nr:hypothetical protein [Tropicibacter oceani]WGW05728.1 hypothetical protein QF118_09335 [Tropicibacter oceani]
MTDPLRLAARHGQWVLIAGLVLGLALPSFAGLLRPHLPMMVVGLLFVSLLRMPPSALLGSLPQLPRVSLTALVLQLALPLLVIAAARATGTATTAVALSLTLVAAAPSIVGSPNIVMIMGGRPDHALRLMVAGTVLLPLTVLPVFALSPLLDDAGQVATAALRLLGTIVLTGAAAMATRRLLFPRPSPMTEDRLQGASALALSLFVIALMPAVAVLAQTSTSQLVFWIAVAFAVNFGAQIVTRRLTRSQPRDTSLSLSLIAGNRNIALFLVSLPPETTAQILPFVGCYQLPMYLTPLLMRRLYC